MANTLVCIKDKCDFYKSECKCEIMGIEFDMNEKDCEFDDYLEAIYEEIEKVKDSRDYLRKIYRKYRKHILLKREE